MSKRKPGCFTIREGLFNEDVEVDLIRQTKVSPTESRKFSLLPIENGSYKNLAKISPVKNNDLYI